MMFKSAPDGAVRAAYDFIQDEYDEDSYYDVKEDGHRIHVYWVEYEGSEEDIEMRKTGRTEGVTIEQRETSATKRQVEREAAERGIVESEEE